MVSTGQTLTLTATLVASLVLSALGTWYVRQTAPRWGLIDVPNARSSHTVAVPRGGGIAIVAVVLGAFAIQLSCAAAPMPLIALLMTSGAVALVGLFDDRYALSPWLRLGVHAVAALGAAVAIGLSESQWISSTPSFYFWLLGASALVWLVAMTNIYNFMDGIDGLAATEGAFVAGAFLVLARLSGEGPAIEIILVASFGACIGFVCWNWPPAKIFMGDVGSGFLGFVFGCCGLMLVADGVPVASVLIVFAVFLVDASITLARRFARGERWYSAHRSHAYQQLARLWGSHRRVTLVVAGINVVWLFPLGLWAARQPELSPIAMALAYVPLSLAALVAGAGRVAE